MSTGTIKFFNANKGFGFVTPDGGGADIFLPAAAATAAGVANVKPGQRVTFEQAPDKKGPKIVALQLLGEPVVRPTVAPAARVTVYCDPSSDSAADVLGAVRAAGYQLQLIDYVTTPPTPDQLRHLSHLLSGSGKSLVRRHDPLFAALQLDDRFIGDQDFWMAVAEHPSLINGPILALAGNARVCKTPEDAQTFLSGRSEATAMKVKTLSPRMAALIRGEPVVVPPEKANLAQEPAPAKSPPILPAAPKVLVVTTSKPPPSTVVPASKEPAKAKRKTIAVPRPTKVAKAKSAPKSVRKTVKKPKK